jgi:3-deoxy-D-manno-octulosonic-acid transferase
MAYDIAGAVLTMGMLPFLPILLLTRHGRGLGERLGRMPVAARQLDRPVWVHAASVGEVLAAEPLIQQLRAHRPELPILVSTTTVAGRETARSRLAVDAAMLLPADPPRIIERAMRRIRPRCVLIMETEIWPGLIRAAARRRVPCLIVSGRISVRAAARYRRVRWLTRAVLPQVSAFAMQSEADAARILTLGAPADRVHVTGSLKYARGAAPGPDATNGSAVRSLVGERVVLVGASTHPGEEQLMLDACAELWPRWPNILLVLAPRRPERFEEVDRLLLDAGVERERRSQLRGPVRAATRVLLLDSLGELPNLLPVAYAVFVGGTVTPIGGHNVLEPAVFGKPVVFGPHTIDVAAAADALLEAGAATRVHDAHDLSAAWGRLLGEPELAARMGACGRQVVAARAAVVQRTFALVQAYLD